MSIVINYWNSNNIPPTFMSPLGLMILSHIFTKLNISLNAHSIHSSINYLLITLLLLSSLKIFKYPACFLPTLNACYYSSFFNDYFPCLHSQYSSICYSNLLPNICFMYFINGISNILLFVNSVYSINNNFLIPNLTNNQRVQLSTLFQFQFNYLVTHYFQLFTLHTL